MPDLEPITPAMESVRLNELADRLGWIAAQLGGIGWDDDDTTVAQASDLIRRQASSVPPVTHDPSNAAPLLWLLWKHLGSQSPVGQPIREYLGMGQFDRMSEAQIEAARGYRDSLDSRAISLPGQPPFPTDHEPPTPAAASPATMGASAARPDAPLTEVSPP